jgi:uncharacterized protein (DUF488 family)
MTTPEIFTIGVYGWDAARFFEVLRAAGIDTFVDVRARRGVRGAEYAFANSQRLQDRLAEINIRYLHRPDLAPGEHTRHLQHELDDAAGGKRRRKHLSVAFVDSYLSDRLAAFRSRDFIESLGSDAQRVVLMCVEGDPAACHRSLLADRLAGELKLEVHHLTP